ATWTPMRLPREVELHDVWGTGHHDVFAVGVEGTLLHYDGVSWARMPLPTDADLHGVWGTGRNDVFVVGDRGTVLNYDGESWSPLRWDPGQISSVWGASPGNVLFAGEGGRIHELLRTAPAR
ncbi:MAG TPA: glucosyltransferase-I, partial [Sorangium sp.]|nr:glucosyltransferase-I [Sorangium sp.]